ncbi:Uma2 family endonuclease [Actinoplanes sp. Pm04-4]|uniref:Uma2 family endonuclease n=1 Tax=Paractinoplanes pyxinae TaxID=2997416 RepID=A0ABT4AU36_9ACTN|nr:Uma2 family endonuclease [Actinoplanes pyxinae]MCY1137766.1 Uma2 family endonuclease [Actinoplanes pyxinae]
MRAVRNDWTADDLDNFPEDNIRREIFDGVLRTRRALPSDHQTLTMLLAAVLMRTCPDHLFVTQANEVELGPRRRVTPDFMAVTFASARASPSVFAPTDVALAAEVISPGTKRIDSVIKLAYYAQAGIPHFWLITMRPDISVTAFDLRPDFSGYHPIATFTGDQHIRLDQPWPVDISLPSIRPRNL